MTEYEIEYINSLIGLPYEDDGRGEPGYDCYGLIIKIAKELFNIDLPDWNVDITARSAAQELTNMKMDLELSQSATEIEKPEDWCVVIIQRRFLPYHMGIYLNKGVIHSSRTDGVIFQKMKQFCQENNKDNMRYWRWLPLIS